MEIKTLLEQYDMFVRQPEEILSEVERLLSQIPGTQEMLRTVPCRMPMVALCGKLIRALHMLGTKQIQFNAYDVLGLIHQDGLGETSPIPIPATGAPANIVILT